MKSLFFLKKTQTLVWASSYFYFFFEYLPFLIYSIRILALNAWKDANVFHPPEATLDYEPGQDVELNLDAENKDSENLRRICEVLMLSNIEYAACQSLNQPILVDQDTTSTPWSEADEHGIRWKEVTNGKYR